MLRSSTKTKSPRETAGGLVKISRSNFNPARSQGARSRYKNAKDKTTWQKPSASQRNGGPYPGGLAAEPTLQPERGLYIAIDAAGTGSGCY